MKKNRIFILIGITTFSIGLMIPTKEEKKTPWHEGGLGTVELSKEPTDYVYPTFDEDEEEPDIEDLLDERGY